MLESWISSFRSSKSRAVKRREESDRMILNTLKERVRDSKHTASTTPWLTGLWRRFPLMGMLALLVAIAASIAVGKKDLVCILTTTDGKPATSTSFRPTVYLSICYTIANIALNFALGQAITVAWWVKALSPGATVKDLHHYWSYGSNLMEILLAGRSFNLVALAGLAVTLVPINGPLLQRASVLHEHTRYDYKNLSIPVAQTMLPGYTGWVTSRAAVATIVGDEFGRVINEYTARQDMNITNSGCLGTCTGHVLGAGYAMTCEDDTVPFNITPIIGANKSSMQYSTAFLTEFKFSELTEGNITFQTLFLNRTFIGLSGFVNRTNCTLQPATIKYPIVFTNDTISLDPESSWRTDEVHSLRPDTATVSTVRHRTTHGGLGLYFQSAYASGTEMWYDGVKGVQMTINGSTIFGYVQGTDEAGMSTTGVGTTFRSPTFDLLTAVRDVAFRTAIRMPTSNATEYFIENNKVNQTALDAWNADNRQRILVDQASTEVIYRSQYVFLIVAVVLTFWATFSVLLIFNGWWHLGRNVSMSPIEIARAFAAPSLVDSDSNAEVKMLLKQVGGKEVRCGAAMEEHQDYDSPVTTLRFDFAEKCSRPEHGHVFGR